MLLALLLAPAVRWLHLRGIGRAAAVFATVLFAFIVIAGFAAAVGDELPPSAANLPKYEDTIATKIRSLHGVVPGAGILDRATQVFHDLGSQFEGSVGASTPSAAAPGERPPVPVEIRQNEPALLQLLRNVIGPMLLPVAEAGLVLLFVIMILLKREDLRDRLLRLAGARDLHRTTAAMNEAAERVSRYLLMQLAVGLCYGLPVGIGLAIIGIPNAPLWGLLGVLLRFVPYIGGPLTAVVPCALAIAVAPGWGVFFWTVLLFIAVETVTANLIEPWIYARTTGLSSVAVVAAATFWTWLWGPVGALLGTPLTLCLVVLGRYLPPLRFLDILLGNQPVLSLQESFYQRLLARDPEEATEQAEEFAREKSIDAFFDADALSTFNLDRLPLRGAAIVCLSLVSTTSPARARYLVRRIRRRARRARLIIGLWGPDRTDFPSADAVDVTAADGVVTSLSAAVAEIEAALGNVSHPRIGLDKTADRLARETV